jgi:hypothetical protein
VRFGGPGAGKLKVNENADGAAATSLQEAFVDPGIALARTSSEKALVADLLSRGATISYDYDKGIRVIRGGTHPVTDAELIPVLPGSLNFVLRWEGNADLNLAVISPEQSIRDDRITVYPIGGLNVIPNGGRTGFDHRGGPNGGMEVVFWPAGSPLGNYFAGSQHMSGGATNATLDVFQGGQRLLIRGSEGPVQTVNYISEPLRPGGDIEGQLIGTVRILEPAAQAASTSASVKKATPTGFVGPTVAKPKATPAAPVRKVRRAR